MEIKILPQSSSLASRISGSSWHNKASTKQQFKARNLYGNNHRSSYLAQFERQCYHETLGQRCYLRNLHIHMHMHTHTYIKIFGNDFVTHELTHVAKSYHSFHHCCPDTLGQEQCLHNLQNNFTHINYFRSDTKLSCTIKHSWSVRAALPPLAELASSSGSHVTPKTRH